MKKRAAVQTKRTYSAKSCTVVLFGSQEIPLHDLLYNIPKAYGFFQRGMV